MFSFWITVAAMAFGVLAVLLRAMMRPATTTATDTQDIDVYRDQLAEVVRDAERGIVTADEAARLRAEIARRILAADKSTRSATSKPASPAVAMGLTALVVLVGSVLLYRQLGAPGYGDLALADRITFAEEMRQNRPDQATAEASLPDPVPLAEIDETYSDLMGKLRRVMAERPDDLAGHVLLAENEAKIGDFAAAARAQAAVVRIKGKQANVAEIVQLAEFYVLAAGGYVSPEAETALRSALGMDRENPRALYYLGLMRVQTGRPDLGFRIWDRLLRQGPEEAPWMAPIRAQIMSVAGLAGVEYDLPTPSENAPGPTAADIDAAGDMTPKERMEMIGAMVDGLSDRLAREGGPPADWARLITALGVLGETDRAAAIYRNGLAVFEGDAGALDMINRAGEQAGVAG